MYRLFTRSRVLLGALAGLACGASGPPPDVLLISLDTVGAQHLGCYGYERDTSPFLDRIAAEGVLFENATAPGAKTAPSHASLVSGVYPTRHGVHGFGSEVPEELPTLAELLASRGYATAAIFNLQGMRIVGRGFAQTSTVPPARRRSGAAQAVAAAALEWVEAAPSPWLLFLHFYDAHSGYSSRDEYERLFAEPYDGIANGSTRQLRRARVEKLDLGAEAARHLRNLYDAGIRQLDAALAELFAGLEQAGHLRNTLVVFVSDHGEEFLQHGGVLHGRTLHQELVRVPLILWGAGVPKGTRVSEPVSLVDVLPTVLALAGAEALDDIDGVDLSPHWRWFADIERRRPVISEANSWIGSRDNFRRAVRRGAWTLHYDGDSERDALYALRSDAGELEDLAERETERAAELRALLAPFVPDEAPPPPDPLPEDLLEELRMLGYVDGAAPAP